jgi:transposase-like protein
MRPLSYRRHRFPPPVIQQAIWLYLRFTLSYRDVEEFLAERGLDLSYETVRRWVLKFSPLIARELRRRRWRPSDRRHLDEMVVGISGRRMYLWRAVDHEGEILDMLVQRRSSMRAYKGTMTRPLRMCMGREHVHSAFSLRTAHTTVCRQAGFQPSDQVWHMEWRDGRRTLCYTWTKPFRGTDIGRGTGREAASGDIVRRCGGLLAADGR